MKQVESASELDDALSFSSLQELREHEAGGIVVANCPQQNGKSRCNGCVSVMQVELCRCVI